MKSDTLNENLADILRQTEIGNIGARGARPSDTRTVDKIGWSFKSTAGIIAGCSGGNYENVIAAACVTSSFMR